MSSTINPPNIPSLTGTALPGEVVFIYEWRNGANVVGSVTADANGHWEFPLTGDLATGSHTLCTIIGDTQSDWFDVANGSQDAPSTPTIDHVLDTLTYPNPDLANGDNLLYNHPIALSGTGAPNSSFYLYDNGNVVALVQVDANGQWQYRLDPPSLGEHAYSTTPNGAAFALEVQPLPPATINHVNDTLTYPNPDLANGDSLLYNHPIALSGSGAPNSSFYLYDNGNIIATVKVDANGQWQYRLDPPSSGEHAYSTSLDGTAFVLNVEPKQVNPIDPGHPTDPVTPVDPVDPNPIAVTIDGLINNNPGHHPYEVPRDGTTDDATPTLYGTAPAGTNVTIIDRTTGLTLDVVRADENGHWQVTLQTTLTEGHHELYATVFGHDSDVFPVNIDFSGSTPVDPSEPVNPVEPGHPTDPVSPVDPTHPTDPTPIVVTIDGLINDNPGHPPYEVPRDGTTDDATPTLYGTASAGTNVTIIDRTTGLTLDVVRADENGHWQVTLQTTLTEGHHELYATVFGHDSDVFPVNIDFSGSAPVDPSEPVNPVDPGHPTDPGTPVDQGHPTDPVTPVDPTHPADPAPIVVTFDGLINDSHGWQEVPRGGTTDDAFPTVYGTGPAGLVVTIIDQATGRSVGGAYIDQDGHWQAKIDVSLSDGHHELYATVLGHNSETFPVNIEFGSSTASADTASTLSVNDLLAHSDTALFGHDAQHAETSSTSTTKLDVQDLSHVQTGGVSADVSAATQHALVPQEQHQHH
jgi:large repetitive protein